MLHDRWMMACVVGFLACVLVMTVTPFPENFGIQIDDDAPTDPMLANVLLAIMLTSILMLWRRGNVLARVNRKLIKAEADAQIAARADPLTGLANRRKFYEVLDELNELEPRKAFALLLIDLDYFKPINDAYGHAAGDQVLVETANRLVGVIPSDALCARMGGDEFSVLLSAKDAANIQQEAGGMSNEICRALSEPIDLTDPLGESVQVFASIGIAPSSMASSATDLIRLADEALYQRKDNGRDGWWIASPPPASAMRRANRDAPHRTGL